MKTRGDMTEAESRAINEYLARMQVTAKRLGQAIRWGDRPLAVRMLQAAGAQLTGLGEEARRTLERIER